MNVWIVSYGEPLVHFDSHARPQRMGLLSRHLRSRGHQVTWWSSTFDHSSRRHHTEQDLSTRTSDGVDLRLVHSGGYSSNVSLARVIDHLQVAARFRKAAAREPVPDLVLASMPPIELAAQAVRFARSAGIPVLLDIRDLWPDVFSDLVPRPARPLLTGPLRIWRKHLAAALETSSGILALSDGYLEWALALAGRARRAQDAVFPSTYPETAPEVKPYGPSEVERWRALGVIEGDSLTNCCFFGTLGRMSDIEVILQVARDPEVAARSVRFIICGSGPDMNRIGERAAEMPNVIVTGRQSFASISCLASIGGIGIAPYRPIDNYRLGLPNKAVEYLFFGLAVLWGVPTGEFAQLIQESRCGLVFDSRSAKSLKTALTTMIDNHDWLAAAGANARKLYLDRYREDVVMTRFAVHLERLVE